MEVTNMPEGTVRLDVDMQACQSYGQCVLVASPIFRLDADGSNLHLHAVDASMRGVVQEAIDNCPMGAIAFVESDGED
jgi:ferredoxin